MTDTSNAALHPFTFKIISGGQTGADRAGLDVAIARGLPHGGWCPKGRKAEDGPLSACYLLDETESGNYLVRTERNAADSDATVIFTMGALTGGSKRTADFARKHGRPFLHLPLVAGGESPAAQQLAGFIRIHRIARLNVAGSRESKAPGMHTLTHTVLNLALSEIFGAASRSPMLFSTHPRCLSIHPAMKQQPTSSIVTNHPVSTKSWSASLQEQTREALEECRVSPATQKLHLKNTNGTYGYITMHDLLGKRLHVYCESSGEYWAGESIGDLLAAGWAID